MSLTANIAWHLYQPSMTPTLQNTFFSKTRVFPMVIPYDPKRRPILIQRDASFQLLISIGHMYHTIEESVNNVNIVTTVSEQNINLSPAQKHC